MEMIRMDVNRIKVLLIFRDENILSDETVLEAIRKIVNSDVIVNKENKLGRRPNTMTENIVRVLNSVDSITTIELANKLGVTNSGRFYRTLDYVARKYNLMHKLVKVRKSYKHHKFKVVKKDRYENARKRMAWISKKTNALIGYKNMPRQKAMKLACAKWKKKFKSNE